MRKQNTAKYVPKSRQLVTNSGNTHKSWLILMGLKKAQDFACHSLTYAFYQKLFCSNKYCAMIYNRINHFY